MISDLYINNIAKIQVCAGIHSRVIRDRALFLTSNMAARDTSRARTVQSAKFDLLESPSGRHFNVTQHLALEIQTCATTKRGILYCRAQISQTNFSLNLPRVQTPRRKISDQSQAQTFIWRHHFTCRLSRHVHLRALMYTETDLFRGKKVSLYSCFRLDSFSTQKFCKGSNCCSYQNLNLKLCEKILLL